MSRSATSPARFIARASALSLVALSLTIPMATVQAETSDVSGTSAASTVPMSQVQSLVDIKKKPKKKTTTLVVNVSGLPMGTRVRARVYGPKIRGKVKFKEVIDHINGRTFENVVPGKYHISVNTRGVAGPDGYFYQVANPEFNVVVKKNKRRVAVIAFNRNGGAGVGSVGAPGSVGCAGPPGAVCAPLKFDLTGAIGVAIGDATKVKSRGKLRDSSTSGLLVISADGSIHAANTSGGNYQLGAIRVAPNGTVYLVFSNPVNLETGQSGWGPGQTSCYIARLGSDGTPTCVETEIQVNLFSQWRGQSRTLQFDDAGNLYYQGYKQSSCGPTGCVNVLRRNDGSGNTYDFLTENAQVNSFLINPSGYVFAAGSTNVNGSSSWWTRVYRPSGGIFKVSVRWASNWSFPLPNGEIMYYANGTNGSGVAVYSPSNDQSTDQGWALPQNYCAPYANWATQPPVCSQGFNTVYGNVWSDNKMFAVAGGWSTGGTLVQAYPTFDVPTTSVRFVSTFAAAGNKLVIAGLDDNDNDILVLRDPDGTEHSLMTPGSIAVYNVTYRTSTNQVVFDGLKYDTNEYVVGKVNLDSGYTASITPTGGLKLVDLQVF